MAVTLPSVAAYTARKLPARVNDNVDGADGYARWWKYPETASGLRSMIDNAFGARSAKVGLIDNSRARRLVNSTCS